MTALKGNIMLDRAISLRQPWASLMAHGLKTIENRPWRTSFRGPILIHASLSWRKAEVVGDWDLSLSILRDAGVRPPDFGLEDMHRMRGGVIGRMDVTGCVDESDNPFFFGPHGFPVENALALEAVVPCKGMLGMFKVPMDVAEACDALMGERP
jgi:hypothetical protein